MNTKRLWTAVLSGALGTILCAASAPARVDPAAGCAAGKIKADGKYSMCLLHEESNAVKKARDADFAKCDAKLTKKWAKLEKKGGAACPTRGDALPLAQQVGSDTAAIVAGLLGEALITNGVIDTEYDILSIEHGRENARTISVEAVDGLGNPVGFTAAAGDGSCVTVSAGPSSITVQGVGHYCEETITLSSATAITKTLAVTVYDPMAMDIGGGLLIKYVNQYEWKWSERELNPFAPVPDVTFLHPVTDIGNGWYPLGSLIIGHHCGGSTGAVNCYEAQSEPIEMVKYPMIVVKQADPGASNPPLMPPEPDSVTGDRYTLIWNTEGGFLAYQGSVWKANCPDGYKAIGVVVNSGLSEPSPDAIRCLREDYTTRAKIDQRLWIDDNSQAYRDCSAWEIGDAQVPSLAGSRAPLNVGTVMGCGGWGVDACDEELARLLLTPMPVAERSHPERAKLRLDENGDIVGGDLRYASSVRVPFTLIPNLACDTDADPDICDFNVDRSPFYRLKRHDSYVKVQHLNNLGSPESNVMHVTYSTGFEQTHTEEFSRDVGLSITRGAEVSFKGFGGSTEVTLTLLFGWSTSDSESYSYGTDLTWDLTVPPFTYGVAVQVQTDFLAFSEHESGPVVFQASWGTNLSGRRTGLTWLQFPPAFP